MREYSKITPQFWLGSTGKKLRGHIEAQVVASYLLTSPHANMLGLYYLPKMFIAHETGIPFEGASKGLARCVDVGFCHYDEENEMVWVVEMALHQVGELKPNDNRCLGIQNEYDKLPKNLYLQGFYDKYQSLFHMKKSREDASPSEAPCKPLRSQEQEQEQEQEKEQEQEQDKCAETATKKSEAKKVKLDAESLVSTCDGLSLDVAKDYIDYRKQKRAPLNQTSWKKIVSEIALSGITPDEALATAMSAGWQGLEASWLINRNMKQSATIIPMSSRPRLPNQMTEEERQDLRRKNAAEAKKMLFGDDDVLEGVASHV